MYNRHAAFSFVPMKTFCCFGTHINNVYKNSHSFSLVHSVTLSHSVHNRDTMDQLDMLDLLDVLDRAEEDHPRTQNMPINKNGLYLTNNVFLWIYRFTKGRFERFLGSPGPKHGTSGWMWRSSFFHYLASNCS